MSWKIAYWTSAGLCFALYGSLVVALTNGAPRMLGLCLLLVYLGLSWVVFTEAQSDWKRGAAVAMAALPVAPVLLGLLLKR